MKPLDYLVPFVYGALMAALGHTLDVEFWVGILCIVTHGTLIRLGGEP